jgi:hypothetical protein
MADAAAWGAVVSILMKLFPSHVTTIASWTEMLLGLGYMLGKCVSCGLQVRKHFQRKIALLSRQSYHTSVSDFCNNA